jgi:2-aminoadipate transaminase
VLRDDGRGALQYAASEGYGPLREQVADMLPWKVDAGAGADHHRLAAGLDLVAKVLIDAGSRMLVETPTYLGALQAFAPMEPEVAGVASDDDGVDIADLAAKAAGARFILRAAQLPEPHRPHHERKRAAPRCRPPPRSWACRWSRTTPTATSGSTQPPPAPLTARNPDGVIYLGSFSKVLAPGLRLGYVVAPRAIAPKLLQAKQAADLHSPGFNQRVVSE